MRHPRSGPTARLLVSVVSAMVATSLMAPLSAAAQDDVASFEAAIESLRDEAQAKIDAAQQEAAEAGDFLAPEAFFRGPLVDQLTVTGEALAAYAAELGALDPPGPYADQVARHVEILGQLVATNEEALTAAREARETELVTAGDMTGALLAEAARELDPDYVRLAFITPFDSGFDYVAAFGSLTPEESEYLEGVVDARNEFGRRADAFREALRGTFPTPEAFLRALYEAGAGEAFAAVEMKALELVPPERFVDEHAWWLERLAIQTAVDRQIGQAARDGDLMGFDAGDIRLGLLPYAYPGFDVAFGAALSPGSPLASQLDVSSAVGRSEYGQAVFQALRGPGSLPIFDSIEGTVSQPSAGDLDAALASIVETGPELQAALDELVEAIVVLEAPDEYAGDHATLLAFFEVMPAHLDVTIEAAEAGDAATIFSQLEQVTVAWCETAAALSEEIEPATGVYFDTDSPRCR